MSQELSIKKDKWIRPWEIDKFDNLKVRDERFFSIIMKGCLGWLTRNILMYNKPIKHFIFSTGSSYVYVETNGYDYSWAETSGEDYMYMQTPRCVCELTDISIPQEELTNPYIRGNYERYSADGHIKGYNAEMRRMPLELNVKLTYVLSNFNETMILMQELIDKLVFQRYYNVTYLGQLVACSIEFPNSESFNRPSIDLASTDDKHRTLEIAIKINTYYPIINEDTEIEANVVINQFGFGVTTEENASISDVLDDKIID